MNMSSQSAQKSQPCAHCQKDATKACDGCKGAPGVEGDQNAMTKYCDKACQEADWKTHKPLCKARRERKVLYRAGDTLQLAYYLFEEHTWFLSLLGAEIKEDPQYLTQWDSKDCKILFVYDSPDAFGLGGSILKPFPNEIITDQCVKKPVLMEASCQEFVWCMHGMIKSMLQGACSNIEELDLRPKNIKLRAVYVGVTGETKNGTRLQHSIVSATTKSGEIYALDVTGSQHGYDDSVIPWEQYATSRVWKIRRCREFGETRQEILSHLGKPDPILPDWLVTFKETCLTSFEISLKEWQEDNVTLSAMLRLPEDAFLKSRTELLNYLEINMKEDKELISKMRTQEP